MVSFWPWKGDINSPASFERTLSTLSAKISKTSIRLDSLRQRSRRFIVLWTLYSCFAYLLCAIILALVVGWRKWGAVEYATVVGGPIVIFLVRLALATYYEFRTSKIQSQLEDLQNQRDATIEKLKTATKYNTTQELLKKYGGTPTPKSKPAGGADRKVSPKQADSGTPKGGRTAFVPPPTANIPGKTDATALQGTPQHVTPQVRSTQGQQGSSSIAPSPSSLQDRHASFQDSSADFAPNAFPAAPQYVQTSNGPRWYDRIMDVLLGEDESLPGKRLALICSNCRLVNGQAPPGIKRLEDVGKWRCGGCGFLNGEESDVKSIVASIKEQTSAATHNTKPIKRDFTSEDETIGELVEDAADGHESDVTQYSSDSSEDDKEKERGPKRAAKSIEEPGTPRRRSTRAKADSKKSS